MATIGVWRPASASIWRMIAGGLEPVHSRHLHVHQHQVESLRGHGLGRFRAVVRNDHGVPALLKNAHRHALIHDIVFGEQDESSVLMCFPAESRSRRADRDACLLSRPDNPTPSPALRKCRQATPIA